MPCRVASGEWRVASGEWRVASGEFVAAVYDPFYGIFADPLARRRHLSPFLYQCLLDFGFSKAFV
jgi:hypothetical protein